jgi:hypothetical protein
MMHPEVWTDGAVTMVAAESEVQKLQVQLSVDVDIGRSKRQPAFIVASRLLKLTDFCYAAIATNQDEGLKDVSRMPPGNEKRHLPHIEKTTLFDACCRHVRLVHRYSLICDWHCGIRAFRGTR